MPSSDEVLYGKIALKEGFCTQEQLDECAQIQKFDTDAPALGEILLYKAYLTPEKHQRVLDIQKKNLEEQDSLTQKRKEDVLFGKLAVQSGMSTEARVNECLRAQAGEGETRSLGEILIERGFLTADQVKELLTQQHKRIMSCPKCGLSFNVVSRSPGKTVDCPKCKGPLQEGKPSETVSTDGELMTKSIRKLIPPPRPRPHRRRRSRPPASSATCPSKPLWTPPAASAAPPARPPSPRGDLQRACPPQRQPQDARRRAAPPLHPPHRLCYNAPSTPLMVSAREERSGMAGPRMETGPGARLNSNALRVLERRYLAKDGRGRAAESADDLFRRVALHVASAEAAWGGDVAGTAARFHRAMASLDFLPNSPTLMNAGRRLGQCFACFVLPVADTISDPREEGIFDAVRAAAAIHQTGGGTGFDFSRLRPEGSPVASTHGAASGPVSFMRVFNAATGAIHQGGFRRGANMGILRVDHPDILDFVNLKGRAGEMTNFNLSVAVTDEFLRAVREDRAHSVLDPGTRRRFPLRDKVRDAEGNLAGYGDHGWSARELLDLIARRAWETGEPGLVFIDRVNAFNPTPGLGALEATNPCGEQALLPWEACNLGSINLSRFVEPAGALGTATSPESRIRWNALAEAAALGVRFLDDVIDVSRYPRPQIERVVKANRKIGLGVMGWADMLFSLGLPYDSEEAVALGRTVMRFVREESWKASMELARERGPFPNYAGSAWTAGHPLFRAPAPMRNALVTTVAPTGTISIIAGCSAGIEPLFSPAFERRVLNGERLPEVHPLFREIAEREGFASPALFERLGREGSCRGIDAVPERWRRLFACAHDVAPEWHVRMQAAFQESTDNGVSKTVNFPESARPEDIRRAFDLAVDLGVKGITVYRDRSRGGQPMALEKPGAPAALAGAVGRLVSLALAHGVPADAVGKAIQETADDCPECGGALRREESCVKCPCGYSRC